MTKLSNYYDKSVKNKVITIILSMLITLLVLYLALVAVFSIPTKFMEKNVSESVGEFETSMVMDDLGRRIDNHIYANLMLTAIYEGSGNPFVDAIKCSRITMKGHSNLLELLDYVYGTSDEKEHYSGKEKLGSEDYGRYWHGYLLLLKPLLCFASYPTIRYVLMFIIFAEYTILVALISKRDKYLLLPVFLLFIFMNPISVSLGIHVFTCASLMNISMILLLLLNDSPKFKETKLGYDLLFLLSGLLTYFFDLLSYPIVVLGVPLVLHIVLNEFSIKESIRKIIRYSLLWGCGYIFALGTKVFLHYLVVGKQALNDAYNNSTRWTDSWIGIKETLLYIFKMSYQPVTMIFMVFFVLLLIYMMIVNKKLYLDLAIPLLIISMMPLCYLLFLTEHTGLHSYFTYREWGITIFAFSCYVSLYYKRCKQQALLK